MLEAPLSESREIFSRMCVIYFWGLAFLSTSAICKYVALTFTLAPVNQVKSWCEEPESRSPTKSYHADALQKFSERSQREEPTTKQ